MWETADSVLPPLLHSSRAIVPHFHWLNRPNLALHVIIKLINELAWLCYNRPSTKFCSAVGAWMEYPGDRKKVKEQEPITHTHTCCPGLHWNNSPLNLHSHCASHAVEKETSTAFMDLDIETHVNLVCTCTSSWRQRWSNRDIFTLIFGKINTDVKTIFFSGHDREPW